MTSSIASRVSRIISGTVNRLVDAAEGLAPDVVMEEAIREVDQAIDEVRAELGRVLAKKHLATTRLGEENRKHEDLSEKVNLALGESREDLAEAAVARILDLEAQIPVLERTIAEAGEAERELEGYVAALTGRRREMRQELAEFQAARKAEQGTGGTPGSDGSPGGDVGRAVDRAEEVFNRVMEQAGGLAGSGRAPDRETASRLAELDALQRENRIRERLTAFKAAQADKDAS